MDGWESFFGLTQQMLLGLWTAPRVLWKWEWANVLSFMTHCMWTIWKVASLRGLWDQAWCLWCLLLWTQLLSSHSLDFSSSESDWNNLRVYRCSPNNENLYLITHPHLFKIWYCQASKITKKCTIKYSIWLFFSNSYNRFLRKSKVVFL